MLRIREDLLETSVTSFQHKDDNDIHQVRFCSCVHLGTAEYFSKIQNLINTWSGIIFQEKITGDKNLYNTIPADKRGLQPFWQIFHALQKMQSQRKTLEYPPNKTISADISWPEMVGLYKTISLRIGVSSEILNQIFGALKTNPEDSYIILWYITRMLLEKLAESHEEVSYQEEWNPIWKSFNSLRNELAEKDGVENSAINTIYDLLVHAYVGEAITAFVPERDTSVLRNVDMERGGLKRDILIVYGVGHYRGIIRGLYDRGYKKISQEWQQAFPLPTHTLEQFRESLRKIASKIS